MQSALQSRRDGRDGGDCHAAGRWTTALVRNRGMIERRSKLFSIQAVMTSLLEAGDGDGMQRDA